MDNRAGTIVSIITYTNDRFTCYAKKSVHKLKKIVCMHV